MSELSNQTPGKDTSIAGASIYLSFDSNSTISNAAYKTMEALGDISNAPDICVDDESHQNSTLEASNQTQMHMMKSMEMTHLNTDEISRLYPKNILREYRAISSTPTKDELYRNTSNTLHSNTVQCSDLGAQSLATCDETNASFIEENKENSHPEKKITDMILTEMITTIEVKEKKIAIQYETDEFLKGGDENVDLNIFPKAPTTCNVDEETVTKSKKRRNSYIPQIKNRKTLCEKTLGINLPVSVIKGPKDSIAPVSCTNYADRNEIATIPSLLDKALRISDVENESNDNSVKDKCKRLLPKRRNSLLPQSEKSTFNFTKRMSTLVKTTLNSPARKIARKSLVTAGTKAPRSGMLSGPSRRSVMTMSCPSKSLKFPESKITRKTETNYLQPLLENPKKSLNSKSGSDKKIDSIYCCDICSHQFRVKSLLDAHKHSHDRIKAPTAAGAMPKKPSSTVISTPSIPSTQCKYCDKKFAIVRALHIHLLEKCTKIPPGDKKNLDFTELNHVGKAQLPPVFSNISTKKLSKSSSTVKSTSMNSMESLGEKKETVDFAQELVSSVEGASDSVAPQSSKLQKKTAHFGVYRTPGKTVPCHLCKKSFTSILDYTNHSMMVHSVHNKNA